MTSGTLQVAIVGGGIGGLTLALSLHAAGIKARVYEAVAELRPLGVGINLLPHAVRELTELGVADQMAAGARAHVVAEGAGALALAAALRRDDRCACIVSGGNIDPDVYAGILSPAAAA